MTFGLAHWVLMLVWLEFGLLLHFGVATGLYGGGVNIILLLILFVLLGWQVFGPPIHRS